MTSAPEAFVIALGRASQRRAYHLLRKLQRADREDVLATAILWCWENRESYDVSVPLEYWFISAVRHAYQEWARGEARTAAELQKEMAVPDETLTQVENASAAEELARAMTPQEREIAKLRAEGYSRAEIRKQLGLSKRAFDQVIRKIRGLRALIPDVAKLNRTILRVAGDAAEAHYPASNIDRAIARMFGGAEGKGKCTTYADDWIAEDRVHVPSEDIRGKAVAWRGRGYVIQDYESDAPNRRLLITEGQISRWLAEEFTRQ